MSSRDSSNPTFQRRSRLASVSASACRLDQRTVAERVEARRPAAKTREPIAAVRRRPEHRVMAAQGGKGLCDMVRRDGGHVAADDHHRPGRQDAQGTNHALAKIAGALREPVDAGRPRVLCVDRAIGRDCQPRPPAAIPPQPAQQACRVVSVEPPGRQIPDIGGQAPLYRAQTRRLDEDHQMQWAPQP